MKIRRVYIRCQSKFMQCGKFRMLIFFPSQPENPSGIEYRTQSSSKRSKEIRSSIRLPHLALLLYLKTSMAPHALVIVYHTGMEYNPPTQTQHWFNTLQNARKTSLEFYNFKNELPIHEKGTRIVKQGHWNCWMLLIDYQRLSQISHRFTALILPIGRFVSILASLQWVRSKQGLSYWMYLLFYIQKDIHCLFFWKTSSWGLIRFMYFQSVMNASIGSYGQTSCLLCLWLQTQVEFLPHP